KYLLGTAGIGFLYVRGALVRELTPTHSGWFAQEDIFAMDISANRPAPSARRFEAGTPAVVNCYAAEAGLALILEVGTQAIEARVRSLTRRCLEALEGIGWASVTPAADARRGPMVCVPARAAAQLLDALLAQDIVVSVRDDNIRAGVHFYNSDEDIDRFVAALAACRDRHHPGVRAAVPSA
ncbi:MAG TPA: aminotransferase class V-fold PLP-dependent enzyme, partial [Steroidobacteraceae bacterium]|nr:aminotransferase class V-fold PLP-dependent enzyme [Steroidobacteraceae bacterium]